MNTHIHDERALISFDDVTLRYFDAVKRKYPSLEFTNIDAKGKENRRTVWIYPADMTRLGNVFIEVWQHRDRFDFVFKKSIITEEEKQEIALYDKKASTLRGRISRCFTFRDELIDYLTPKLDRIGSVI